MRELKQRHVGVADILKGKHELQKWMVQDICYLQFRFMCELIALGSLVMHGDIPEANSSRLRDAYKADKIINLLSQLHPQFYPRPVEAIPDCPETIDSEGKHSQRWTLKSVTDDYLTKDDLVSLWRECGERLHAGTLNTVTTLKRIPFDPAPLYVWASKISRLLNIHAILPKDEQHLHIVFMQGVRTGTVEIGPMARVGSNEEAIQFAGTLQSETWSNSHPGQE